MRKLFINRNPKTREAWEKLLKQEGISYEAALEETYGLYENEQLIGTASRYHNVIKCVAVDSTYQGGAIFNQIITFLMNRIFENGYYQAYIYTKPESQKSFEYLGFKAIESVDNKLVFMERAVKGFGNFIQTLEKGKVPGNTIASIVMNANPFTLGHQFLVTKAAQENDVVHVFVLSEELSAFDADTRFKLVKQGTAHLNNVHLHPTRSYMVSAATFPSYFLKEDDDVTSIQARLDARIFANHIAPALGITHRYVGSEPLSHATNLYNQAMQKEFQNKLELVIVERLENEDNTISASMVRKYIAENNLEIIKQYVPETTYQFLLSDEGQRLVEKLQND